MFTGLIQSVGRIQSRRLMPDGLALYLSAPEVASKLRIGDSLAVNGVCLSLEEHSPEGLRFFASNETLEKTNLSKLQEGSRINLELPLQPQSYLGGHWVQGHVDGRAKLTEILELENIHLLQFEVPTRLLKYLVQKGSVTLDGVSLTINEIQNNQFSVCIIPETWKKTNFSDLKIGMELNIEVDVLAKYVERQLEFMKAEAPHENI